MVDKIELVDYLLFDQVEDVYDRLEVLVLVDHLLFVCSFQFLIEKKSPRKNFSEKIKNPVNILLDQLIIVSVQLLE
jgi:hypothetical protein